MQHKCAYFNMVNGVLTCSQCGKEARNQLQIEDKKVETPENKVRKNKK